MIIDPRIEAFARAIASAEGFGVPHAIPTKAHNPGDLVIPGWHGERMGAGISVFDSDEEGWLHLYHELGMIVVGASHIYNLKMSIREMADRWTLTDSSKWANNVAEFLGVDPETVLETLLT